MFKTIRTIDDVLPFVATKKEISRIPGPAGSTTLCYQFQDSNTFDSPEALECRGIVFDRNGNIAARPLHKFFNLGEHGETADTVDWSKATRVMEKLDGSMIHTVWLDGQLYLKSKKSFDNAQTKMAWEWLRRPENAEAMRCCEFYASRKWTLIFELTSPSNRIVVAYPETQMRLLHARHNQTGEYWSRDALDRHCASWGIPLVEEPPYSPRRAVGYMLDELEDMTGVEGYVIQFTSGHMLKVKCPWYLQLHRTVSFTRERDIAEAALDERLDDIKAALAGMGHDLGPINAIESEVLVELLAVRAQVESTLALAPSDRKTFATIFRDHELFHLLMPAFLGKDVDYKAWYRKNRLKQRWSLDPVADVALEDA